MDRIPQNAFTILELMIVVSIIVTLSAFSVMVYSRNIRVQRFEYEVSRFLDILHYARQNALINNTEGFQCPDYYGHKVLIHDTEDAYSLQICCYEDCTCDPVRPTYDPTCQVRNIQDYALGDNISFGDTTRIRFREKAGGTGEATAHTITIESTTLNTCIDIRISPTGLIERQDEYDC
jgi:prepilin-type N-terminal cleavage/methylation domain-containing protein